MDKPKNSNVASGIKLIDTISLDSHKPSMEDIHRVLGIERLVEENKTKWLNIGQVNGR